MTDPAFQYLREAAAMSKAEEFFLTEDEHFEQEATIDFDAAYDRMKEEGRV